MKLSESSKAGIKANRYIRENRDGTLPVMVEWLKIDKEMATATYDSSLKSFSDDLGLPEDGLRLLISEAKRTAKVDREVSVSEVADLSILRQAQRELGDQAVLDFGLSIESKIKVERLAGGRNGGVL